MSIRVELDALRELAEGGPSVQKHGMRPASRRTSARGIYQAAKAVKDKRQKNILNAMAAAIEDGEAKIACDLYGRLSAAGRKALPRGAAMSCAL